MRADVLVFDHSKLAFATLKAFLIQHGYTVVLASNISEAEYKTNKKRFDLIIVQESIREEEFKEFSSFLHNTYQECSLIVLKKDFSVTQRIEALEVGADDCLNVPYHPKELLLKLEKLLQHKHVAHGNTVKTTQYELDVKTGDLTCPWGKIWLRKKEFMIMSILLQQKNQVVSKEQLIEKIWSLEETPQYSTVDVHIRRIRQKLRDAEKTIIKTAHGVGYMFCE